MPHSMAILPLLLLPAAAAVSAATFSSLTLVGERWDNGAWSELDADGHEVGPPLKRGDPKAQLITSPQQSPDLLRLSATTVLCTANDTVMASTDAGRSWTRVSEAVKRASTPEQIGGGYIPSPAWLRTNESAIMESLWMSIQPVSAYVEGCYPLTPNCSAATSVTADAAKQYVDWGLAGGAPQALKSVGRKSPNVWSGLPHGGVTEMCTSCGSGIQLADGSFVYLVVVQFGPVWQTQPVVDKTKRAPCCNNSVVSFTSPDGLEWVYGGTVGLYDEQRLWQEGPNECDVVLLKDKKTL